MNLVLGLFCHDLREVMGYVRVTNVVNYTNDSISEEAIAKQIYDSWSDFQDNGGGKVSKWIEDHNETYATKVEAFRVIIV